MIRFEPHTYTDGETRFVGKLAWDDALQGPRPGVLVVPAFGGLGPVEETRAMDLAALGYVALAVDYYGDGKRAGSEEEAFRLMGALDADRSLLARRMQAALTELKSLDRVVAESIGAVGFCFGGKCVLDLARSGAKFKAAVSVHGVYDPPVQPSRRVDPAVLILHGWEDPLTPTSDLLRLAGELTATCDDWQLLAFGHTGHAFTNPNAQEPEQGMAFNPVAADRAWGALNRFLEEQFAKPA